MKRGQIVKFAQPEDAEEAAERYIVIEDRDTRVLLVAESGFEDWYIQPTFVYDVEDLEVVGEVELPEVQ
jgi:hypothetical protein